MEEGTLLGNPSTAVIYNMNKPSSAYFLEAADASLLSINMHTAGFQSGYSQSQADNSQCPPAAGVEVQGRILQSAGEGLSPAFIFPFFFWS